MSAADAISLTDGFDAAGIRYWIGGGWGVDALLCSQTRDHDDLDIAVPAEQEAHRGYDSQDKDRADLQALVGAGLIKASEAEA